LTRPPSIRRTLVLSLAGLLGVLWLAGTGVSMLVAGRALDRAFDSAQLEVARRLLPLAVEEIVNRDTGERAEGPERVASLLDEEDRYTYLVRDAAGTVLLRSYDADVDIFPDPGPKGFADAGEHRFYTERAIQDTVVIQVADPVARRRAARLNTGLGLLAPLPVVLAVGGLGIWTVVRRGLRSMAQLRRQIERRHGDALDPIPAADLPEEVAPLAGELNRLMDRVRRTIEAERNFTANSAHELRTPLAGALAQVQLLISEAPEGPLRQRAVKVQAGLRALSSLAGKLVDLSRAEAGLPMPAEPVDLAPVLDLVIADTARAEQAGDRVHVERSPAGPMRRRIDPDAFAILLRNLVENALRHGDPSEPVRIAVDGGTITVVNGGPAIDPDGLERLRRRFVRASAAPGSGLGLSIADAVTRTIGADLNLRSPASGRQDGFEAVVRLPDEG
jgi:two-component system OmpR family sensor kinase